jgi:hypothetical protein
MIRLVQERLRSSDTVQTERDNLCAKMRLIVAHGQLCALVQCYRRCAIVLFALPLPLSYCLASTEIGGDSFLIRGELYTIGLPSGRDVTEPR